jgi:SAM-dependent methyltransferase
VPAGPVLDLACGGGRHGRLFHARGHPVTLVDRDLSGVADLAGLDRVEAIATDLEDGRPFPLAGRGFAGVVVTNYLYRPLLPALVAAVQPGGVLLYETFAQGQQHLGRPTNPDFLLAPGELLEAVRGALAVTAYEDRTLHRPDAARVQRICAVRSDG